MRAPLAVASFLLALAAAPSLAEARVDIRIDLASQSMRVVDVDGRAYRWAISSGRKGFRTPTGSYSSQRLARMHYSSKYDDAPMPHSIFFSGGYAIHGTGSVGLLGRPASHGCVRLAPGNAAKLFAMVRASGARISIAGVAPDEGRAYASARPKRRVVARDEDDLDETPVRARPAFAYQRLAPRGGFYDAPRPYWILDGAGGAGWMLR